MATLRSCLKWSLPVSLAFPFPTTDRVSPPGLVFLPFTPCAWVCRAQLCPILCDLMDCAQASSVLICLSVSMTIFGIPGCQGPASTGSRGTLRMNGIGKRERRHMRPAKSAREERERETRRGCSRVWQCCIFLPWLLYPKLVHFSGEDSLTLHQLVLQETGVFSAYFFLYEGLVHYLLAVGPINILCRSGECKPIFCFSGDFN